MTDGIIKGTGNSRVLKSVPNAPTLYPTHEALMEALATAGLPVDLPGINPAGWQTVGDKLGKATLLTDAVASALGLSASATPSQALDKLRQLVKTAQTGVDNAPKILFLSYVGTGMGYDQSHPASLVFPFAPKFVFLYAKDHVSGGQYQAAILDNNSLYLLDMPSLTTAYTVRKGLCDNAITTSYGKKSPDGKTLYWYNTFYSGGNLKDNATMALNNSSFRYSVLAIG